MMEPSLWVKAAAKALLLPPTGLLILALVGLAMPTARGRLGRRITATALLALTLISTPLAAEWLIRMLDSPPPFSASTAADAGAIVVLGGGVRRHAADFDGADTLNALTLERIRYAARIAKATSLPVLVSGGSPQGGEAEATIMARALEQEFGVQVRWREAHSRNTHENAVYASALLRGSGIAKIVLVVHGFDTQRAKAEFQAAGIDVIPAATGLAAERRFDMLDLIPSMSGLARSYYAIYEILANARFQWFGVGRTSPIADVVPTGRPMPSLISGAVRHTDCNQFSRCHRVFLSSL